MPNEDQLNPFDAMSMALATSVMMPMSHMGKNKPSMREY